MNSILMTAMTIHIFLNRICLIVMFTKYIYRL